jgi:hypothetical protein
MAPQWLDLAQGQAKQRPSRIKQAWIAASGKGAGRPRLPLGAAVNSIWGPNQISSDPRGLRAALSVRQVVVR